MYDVKFLALLGDPYIYDISRLRVNFQFTEEKETMANRFSDLGLIFIDSQTQQPSSAVKGDQGYSKNFTTHVIDESIHEWKGDTGTCMCVCVCERESG
jgi:hypothetical protein